MNNENKLKSEFNNFVEDLVKDIIKSVLYEDFKELQEKYDLSNENLDKISKNMYNMERSLYSTVGNIKSSVKDIDESSKYLNQNIEKLTEEIQAKVKVRLEEFLEENKKNMQDLSEEVQFMRDELIRANKLNEQKISKKMYDTEVYLQKMNNDLVETTNDYQANLGGQIFALQNFTKKMGIGMISLGILNVVLVIYIIVSSLGVI